MRIVNKCVCFYKGSGATCLAHCDGSRTWGEVPLIVNSVTSLTGAVKDGR